MKLAIDNTFAARSVIRRRVAPTLPAEPKFQCDGGRAAWVAEEVFPQVTPLDAFNEHWTGTLTLAQATVANQPAWDIYTGWRGNGAATIFDGVDDFMTVAATTDLPTGSSAGEIWLLVNQLVEATTTDALTIFGYGGTTAGTFRAVQRVVVDGVNRVAVTDGTVTITDDGVDFSGPHVVRAWWDGALMGLAIDGRDVGSTALVPATGTDVISMAKATSGTGSTWGGEVLEIMVGTGICTESDISHNEQFGAYWRS